MDPVTALGTIAAIQQLGVASGTVAQFCYGYVKKYKNASIKIQELERQLRALDVIYGEVGKIIRDHDSDLQLLNRLSPIITDTEKFVLEILAELPLGKLGRRERLAWPFTEDKTSSLVDALIRNLVEVDTALELENFRISEETREYVKSLQRSVAALSVQLDQVAQDETRSKILKWISFNQFRSLRFKEQQQDRRSLRQLTTGRPILAHKLYREWKSRQFYGRESWLWAIGEAGSRKSTIMSVLVDNLIASHLDAVTEIAVLYCQSEITGRPIEQTVTHILGNLTAQLVRRQDQLPHQLVAAYNGLYDQGEPSAELAFDIFLSAVQSLGRVYLIVDGLDELKPEVQTSLLQVFDRLHQERIKFLISSRPHPSLLKTRIGDHNILAISPTKEEIAAYLTDEIANNDRLQLIIDGNPKTTDDVVKKICERASHSFTFAVAMLGTIQTAISKSQIFKLIESSKTLNDVFSKTMQRIHQRPEKEKAISVLGWLTYARAPLTLEQLRIAMAVSPEEGFDEDDVAPRELIPEICEGLIQIIPASDTVTLTHLTAREFLVAQVDFEMIQTERKLAQICIRYLMSPKFDKVCTTEHELRSRQTDNVFISYAASYWASHAKAVDELKLEELICQFALQEHASSALQILPPEISELSIGASPAEYRFSLFQESVPAWYLLAQFGLHKSQQLLTLFLPPSAKDAVHWGQRYSPLHLAVWLEDEETANILLKQGVNVNHQARYEITPVHLAASLSVRSGPQTYRILECILDAMNDVKISEYKDHDGDTALHSATRVGVLATIKLLLKKGYNANAVNRHNLTPLHLLIRSADAMNMVDRNSIIEAMLTYGADPTIPNGNNKSALSLVVAKEWAEQVLQFREAQNPTTGHPYEFSSEEVESSDSLYQLALENRSASLDGVQIPQRTKPREEQLNSALEKFLRKVRKTPTVQHLNLNARQPFSALSYAARKGGCDTIELLLAGQGDVNACDTASGRTALHFAAEMNRYSAILMLLSAGADPHIKDHQGIRPFDLLSTDRSGAVDMSKIMTNFAKIRREGQTKFTNTQDREVWIAEQIREMAQADPFLRAELYDLQKYGPHDPVKLIKAQFR